MKGFPFVVQAFSLRERLPFVVQAFSLRQQPERLHHNARASIHGQTLFPRTIDHQ